MAGGREKRANDRDVEASTPAVVNEPDRGSSHPCWTFGIAAGFLLLGFVAVMCATEASGLVTTESASLPAGLQLGRRLEQDPWETKARQLQGRQFIFQNSLYGILHVVAILIYAYFYNSKLVAKVVPMQVHKLSKGDDHFEDGFAECLVRPHYCLMVLFCSEVRQAHTNDSAGICGFWTSMIVIIFSQLCLLPCCGPCCLNVYFRMHLKDMLGIEDSFCHDYVAALIFMPCSIGQQAIAIDTTLDYHVQCCCNKVGNSEASGGGSSALLDTSSRK